MQFTTLLATAVLAMGANAAAVRRDDPHVAQFSGFRESKCSGTSSAGQYVVLGSGINLCEQISPPAAGLGNVRSVDVEDLSVADGCTLHFYTDVSCTSDSADVSEVSCLNVPEGADYFQSYKVTC